MNTNKAVTGEGNAPRGFNFNESEKRAAQIVDQLCPVFMDATKAHVGPELFKCLTLRLAELLEEEQAQRYELLAALQWTRDSLNAIVNYTKAVITKAEGRAE